MTTHGNANQGSSAQVPPEIRAMQIARAVLGSAAGVFGTIGLACLVWPVELLGTVDVALPTPTARVEIYAWYGGLQLGIALFLAFCAWRGDWVKLGLAAAALMLGGLGAARLAGSLLAGPVSPVMLPIAVSELAGAALCIWAARRLPMPRSPLWF